MGTDDNSEITFVGSLQQIANDLQIQSNFSGSNTFGTMKISSRQG